MSKKPMSREEQELFEEKVARREEEVRKILEKECRSHNRKPVTRREFLNSGLIAFGATYTAPVLGMLFNPNQAIAAECQDTSGASSAGLAPFITLSLAGGWGGAGNYVPMTKEGAMLSDYRRMGLGRTAPVTRAFNNAPFAGNGVGQFLPGIQAAASAATIANTAFLAIPVRNQNDTDNSDHAEMDISGMVAKAGLAGTALPNLGSRSSSTGNKHNFAHVRPPNPLRVRGFNDISAALGQGAQGALAGLDQEQQIKMRTLIQRLSGRQIASVMQDSGGKSLAGLIECATGKNVQVLRQNPPSPDVRQTPALANIWGVNNGTNQNDRQVAFGSMVLAGLRGTAGTVSLEVGGYDYHDDPRNETDQKDREAGQIVGRVLETAANMGQKVAVHIISDGSVRANISNNPGASWDGDNSESGVMFMFFYDPAGRPSMSDFQVGGFNNAQAADGSFFTGDNPRAASAAAFANYLKFSGKMDLLEAVIPGELSSSQVNQVIKVG